MRQAVAALGVTQIIGYGTLYYAFPVLVPGMAAEFGIDPAWLFAAFSGGLLAGGLVAPRAGRAMDRFGPARVMVWGSVLAAGGLGALALLPLGPWGAAALIVALELAAVCVTYDAAFATLAVLRGAGARRAITNLTLIAGFASTLFWPLTGWLGEAVGWRGTYAIYAGLHLMVALPLHLALARAQPEPLTPDRARPVRILRPLPPAVAQRGFWLLASSFTLTGVLIAALVVHMVPVLQGLGFGTAAFAVAMVMGPAQVAIRLVDALAWQGLHPVTVALVSAVVTPLGALVLLAAPQSVAAAVAFAALFGAGQGLASIVRGSVPLALFGAAGYGALLGRLAGIRQVAAALAPLGFALALTRLGTDMALALAVGLGVAGVVPLVALAVLVRRAGSG
jgi:MFS family permease